MNHLAFDNIYVGIALITLAIAVALLLQRFIKARFGVESLEALHEVGGNYFSAIGTLYSVILGLVLIDATSKFNDAKQYTENEASALIEIFALAERLPIENQQPIREKLREYVDEIIEHEWIMLEHGEKSPLAKTHFINLVKLIRTVEPITENQKAIYPNILSAALVAAENRRGRLNFFQYSIPTIEWVSLLIGGAVTIAFTMFFATHNDRVQALMTAMVTLMVTLNLYIVFLFNDPYSGSIRVSDEPFRSVQTMITDNPSNL